MSVIPLIESGILLATEIFKKINDDTSRKYSDELISLKKDRLEEIIKPIDEQQDAKIQNIDARIIIIQNVAASEIRKYETS